MQTKTRTRSTGDGPVLSGQERGVAVGRGRLRLGRVALQQHAAAAVRPGRAARRRQPRQVAAAACLLPLHPPAAVAVVVVPFLALHGAREPPGQRVQPLVEDAEHLLHGRPRRAVPVRAPVDHVRHHLQLVQVERVRHRRVDQLVETVVRADELAGPLHQALVVLDHRLPRHQLQQQHAVAVHVALRGHLLGHHVLGVYVACSKILILYIATGILVQSTVLGEINWWD